ncbi:hypothetical protein DMENIID0001_010570 [Sergentomyia squamirostris]
MCSRCSRCTGLLQYGDTLVGGVCLIYVGVPEAGNVGTFDVFPVCNQPRAQKQQQQFTNMMMKVKEFIACAPLKKMGTKWAFQGIFRHHQQCQQVYINNFRLNCDDACE